MKITSNLKFNTSLFASHVVKDEETTKVVIGSTAPEYLNIPAGSTIELDDLAWVKFAKSAKQLLAKGDLTMTESPKLTEEDQAAADEARMVELEKEAAKIKSRKQVKPEAKPETKPVKEAK
jgi:hypothetical protein